MKNTRERGVNNHEQINFVTFCRVEEKVKVI